MARRVLIRSRVLPLGISAALVVGVVSAVTFAGAGQIGAAPAKPATPVASRPDAVSAALAARLQGTRVEVTGLDAADSTTWVNPDGTFTTDTASEPFRVARGTDWVDVDTSLQTNPDGSVTPAATTAPQVFGGAGSTSLATMTLAGVSSVMGWASKLPKPTLDGASATYANVPGTDLKVTASNLGYEMFLVLKVKPTRSLGTVSLPLRGVSATQDRRRGRSASPTATAIRSG